MYPGRGIRMNCKKTGSLQALSLSRIVSESSAPCSIPLGSVTGRFAYRDHLAQIRRSGDRSASNYGKVILQVSASGRLSRYSDGPVLAGGGRSAVRPQASVADRPGAAGGEWQLRGITRSASRWTSRRARERGWAASMAVLSLLFSVAVTVHVQRDIASLGA